MAQLTQEELRQKMAEILKDQMERPSLFPRKSEEHLPTVRTEQKRGHRKTADERDRETVA
jgi:hypothetical protein